MPTHHKEDELRCGGCDCIINDDGCECRVVPCSKCGQGEHLYDMIHPEYHTAYWFENMSFDEKICSVICQRCVQEDDEEEDEDDSVSLS